MHKYLLVILICMIAALEGCKSNKVCPAYQSSFIHGKEKQEEFFSYFGNDSLPKDMSTDKDKHGIAQGSTPKTYKKDHYNVPKQDVYPDDTTSKAVAPEIDNKAVLKDTSDIHISDSIRYDY